MGRLTKQHYQSIIQSIIDEARAARLPTPEPKGKACSFPADFSETGRGTCYTCAEHHCERFWQIGLDVNGAPLSRKRRPRCGAKTRSGAPCKMRCEAGKRRCRLHGGASTGPKTAEGRSRIAAAQKRRWAAYRGRAG